MLSTGLLSRRASDNWARCMGELVSLSSWVLLNRGEELFVDIIWKIFEVRRNGVLCELCIVLQFVLCHSDKVIRLKL